MAFKCDKCGKKFDSEKEAEKHENNCDGKNYCPNCNKKLSPFKTGILYYSDGKRFCSFKCKDSYKNENILETTNKKISSKSINEKQYANLNGSDKGNYIKEWVCKCNECGKKWAYLDSVEKEMRRQATGNALMGLGMCCNPCMVLATSNANTQLSKQIKELKQCPECKSSNVKCETRYFKKS